MIRLIKQKYLLFIIGLFLMAMHRPDFAQTLNIYTEEWKPVSFSENGELKGLGVEIVQEILNRHNSDVTIAIVPWARGWEMIQANPNTILFTMTITPKRVKMFKLVGPVAIGETNFYAKKGTDYYVTRLEDAKVVKRIGVYQSAVEEQYLIERGFTNLESTALPFHSAKKLMLGRINLWCNADLTAPAILQKAGYSIEDVATVYTVRKNHLYIAFSATTSDSIVIQWKNTLQEIKEDGTFTKMYRKWLPDKTPPLYTKLINRVGHQPSSK